MKRRPCLATLGLVAACAHTGPAAVAPAPPAPPAASPPAPVRYFHANPEESFWVSRAPDLDGGLGAKLGAAPSGAPIVDRVVAAGVRLEVGPGGEIRDAAWDTGLTARGEQVLGALAVPERLGGGFVVWTRARVYRARTFTGPLSPVPVGVTGDVRGVRAGLSSVIAFTESGPRELTPGAASFTAPRDPALLDLVAVSAERAARLDVFGRLWITGDGGARWTDLSARTGLVRLLSVGPREVWIEGWQGRFLVDPSGKLDPADPPERGSGYEQPRAFQTVWRAAAREHEDWPWGLHEATPLAVAVAAGGDVGDGSALGVVQGAVVRVDLATGTLLTLAVDWIPGGLTCQPVRAPDGVLFACLWDRSQGYGGYVLRSVGGGPPETEKAFGEDGSFFAADDGAIGFVGSCRSEPRTPDPNDQSRWEMPSDPALRPVFCVRRGPGEWVERRADLGEGATVAAWVPRLDGTAVALALSSDPLPPPAGARRVIEQGGVRIVRVYPEIPGVSWDARNWLADRPGVTGFVDRRFRVRDDGSVDAWLMPASGDRGAGASLPVIALSVTLDPGGIPAVHDPPPAVDHLLVGGSFALSIAADGALHESTDHGHTWRPAGRSPQPGGGGGNLQACSALGCALGAVVRAGWGDAALDPHVAPAPPLPADTAKPPRLVCAPRGAPVPLVAPPAAPAGTRQTLSTGWGDTLHIDRDADAPAPPPPPARPSGTGPPSPSPTAAPTATPAAPPPPRPRVRPSPKSPAVLRTHTLVLRQPFAPFAAPRRLNATDASLDARRTSVVPLLTPSGEVDVLVGGDQSELLVSGDHITVLPAEGTRRYGGNGGSTGLALPGGRALVLGDVRRRLALEDHGPGPVPPPLFLGMERNSLRRRTLAIARRDDGALGVIVADGSAPETAGVALLDRLAGGLRPPERLAPWSSLAGADDPRCKKGSDPLAWEALLVVDPSAWLALDAAALPGISLAHQGLLAVRWGKERVCLEAIDAAATDENRRGETARAWSVVARFRGEKDRGAALRAADLRLDLVCRIEGG